MNFRGQFGLFKTPILVINFGKADFGSKILDRILMASS